MNNNESLDNAALFDLVSVQMDSPRLKQIKEHDIQTHHNPHFDKNAWLAVPMNVARKKLKDHITKDDPFDTAADITASMGLTLDDAGILFYGDTEKEAQDAAVLWCMVNAKGEL